MRKIFSKLTVVLIVLVFLTLLAILYTGGLIDVFGIRVTRIETATLVITLCILFSLYRLIRTPLSLRQAIVENSVVLLICLTLILYLGNYRTLSVSDTTPARYLPMSILREGNFDLDEFRNLHPRAALSGLVYKGNHYLSSYPVGAPLFALPVYLISAIGPQPANSWFTRDLDKLAASLTVLLSVIVLYFAALRLTSRNMALLISAIYALGTSSFSVSSQALWQHGASQLCLTSALYCLLRGSKEMHWISFAGFPAAFAVICRPTDALLVAPMGLFVLFHHPRKLAGFLLCAMPPIIFQLTYNYYYFDNPFRTQFQVVRESFWSTPLLNGAANILISPARGLFIYSPIFIFSFISMILAWMKGGTLLFRYLSIGVIANLLLYSKFFMWWGGYTYGPRLLADLSPILCLFLCEIKTSLTRVHIRNAFLVLAVLSFAAHGIGAYADDSLWNVDMDIDSNPQVAWNWSDNQLVTAPKHALNKTRIWLLGLPTTRSDPELFKADFRADLPKLILIRPLRRIPITVQSINSGKAVWLNLGPKQPGTVALALNWYRKNKLVDRFAERRRIRYQVFPGDSYRFYIEPNAPEKEGRYYLEITVVLTQHDSEIKGKSIYIPVRVIR